MPEKTERGTLWYFSTSIQSQNFKEIEGGTLWGFVFDKKSQCRKKLNSKGDINSMLRGKKGKTFLVQFLGPTITV